MDAYLDIVVIPSGEVIQKDAEELDEALLHGIINRGLYNLAKHEAYTINSLIEDGNFSMLKLTIEHNDLLLKILRKQD